MQCPCGWSSCSGAHGTQPQRCAQPCNDANAYGTDVWRKWWYAQTINLGYDYNTNRAATDMKVGREVVISGGRLRAFIVVRSER
jgi:hypothetical protein